MSALLSVVFDNLCRTMKPAHGVAFLALMDAGALEKYVPVFEVFERVQCARLNLADARRLALEDMTARGWIVTRTKQGPGIGRGGKVQARITRAGRAFLVSLKR